MNTFDILNMMDDVSPSKCRSWINLSSDGEIQLNWEWFVNKETLVFECFISPMELDRDIERILYEAKNTIGHMTEAAKKL